MAQTIKKNLEHSEFECEIVQVKDPKEVKIPESSLKEFIIYTHTYNMDGFEKLDVPSFNKIYCDGRVELWRVCHSEYKSDFLLSYVPLATF